MINLPFCSCVESTMPDHFANSRTRFRSDGSSTEWSVRFEIPAFISMSVRRFFLFIAIRTLSHSGIAVNFISELCSCHRSAVLFLLRGMWITDQLPDSDMTVLMKLSDAEFPIWPGFHDGERWCSADALTVVGPVLGWMELETAAKLLT